jgi:pSer/pThr/pTyr-binding forkhead associated (FHA) protein
MKLIIEDDEGRRTVVPIFRDDLLIGRAEGSAVRLTAKDVSRRHAKVVRRDGRMYVEDLNSFTGVRVNGDRVHGLQEIDEGDLIEISEYDLTLQRSPDEEPLSGASSAEDVTAPIRGARRRSSARTARIATFVLAFLIAATLATALWLRSLRGAEASEASPNTGIERNSGSNSNSPRGSAPPEPRGDVR